MLGVLETSINREISTRGSTGPDAVTGSVVIEGHGHNRRSRDLARRRDDVSTFHARTASSWRCLAGVTDLVAGVERTRVLMRVSRFLTDPGGVRLFPLRLSQPASRLRMEILVLCSLLSISQIASLW